MTWVHSVKEPELFVFIRIKVTASRGFPHMLNRVTVQLHLYCMSEFMLFSEGRTS